jgi:hypothetical protein
MNITSPHLSRFLEIMPTDLDFRLFTDLPFRIRESGHYVLYLHSESLDYQKQQSIFRPNKSIRNPLPYTDHYMALSVIEDAARMINMACDGTHISLLKCNNKENYEQTQESIIFVNRNRYSSALRCLASLLWSEN